nr:acetyltransferase [Salmonella sp. NCTC 7297]
MPRTIFCQTLIGPNWEELVSDFLPEAPLWVAVTEQGEPVGFMLLTGEHMDALFIDPDVRGQGIGKRLV